MSVHSYRHKRVFARHQSLPCWWTLHKHRGLIPLPARGELWDGLWAHRQQHLQGWVKTTVTTLGYQFIIIAPFNFIDMWPMTSIDIDECETEIHNCGGNFQCQNTQGSFRCLPKVKCGAGYIQDALGNCIGEQQQAVSSPVSMCWCSVIYWKGVNYLPTFYLAQKGCFFLFNLAQCLLLTNPFPKLPIYSGQLCLNNNIDKQKDMHFLAIFSINVVFTIVFSIFSLLSLLKTFFM